MVSPSDCSSVAQLAVALIVPGATTLSTASETMPGLSCQAREGGRWQWIPAGAAPWGGRLGGRHPACYRPSTCWALPTPPAPDVRDGAPAPCIPQIATGLSKVSDCGVAKSDTFSLKQSISKTVLKDARGDQS